MNDDSPRRGALVRGRATLPFLRLSMAVCWWRLVVGCLCVCGCGMWVE